MDKCIICDVETMKYKCPKCLARYCSVSCCRTHKEKCTETPVSSSTSSQSTHPTDAETDRNVPNYPLWTAKVSNKFPREDLDDESDMVPEDRLELLRDNKQIKDMLCNPHVRAMCENLVNSENPSLDMAKAMQEPIFVELTDECLKVVDRDNPHLIADESLMDDV